MKNSSFSFIIRVIGLTIILIIWKWFIDQQFELMTELTIIKGGVIAVVPISFLGRLFLNKYDNSFFHYDLSWSKHNPSYFDI